VSEAPGTETPKPPETLGPSEPPIPPKPRGLPALEIRTAIIAVVLAALGWRFLRRSVAYGLWWDWAGSAAVAGLVAAVVWSYRRQSAAGAFRHVRWVGWTLWAAVPLLAVWTVLRIPASMGEGPAGPAVDRAAFAKPWRTRPVMLVAVGDSVSTGYGAGPGMGYVDLLTRNNDDAYPDLRGVDLSAVTPNLTVVKRAQNSTNSISHGRIIAGLETQPPDVFGIVCITTGGIDLIHWYGHATPKEGAMYGATLEQAAPWLEAYEARLDRMAETLKAKFPGGCLAVFATVYDPTDGVGDIEDAGVMFWLPPWPDGLAIHARMNEAIRRVAARHFHVRVAEVHAALLGHGIHCLDPANPHHDRNDPTYWYFANLEDPNRRGYDAVRRAFLNAIAGGMSGR
jgi:lysophospholipase L1-like esterase